MVAPSVATYDQLARTSKLLTNIILAPPTGQFGNLLSPAKGTIVLMQGVLAGANDSELAESNLKSVMFISNANRPGFSSSGSGPLLLSSTLDTAG